MTAPDRPPDREIGYVHAAQNQGWGWWDQLSQEQTPELHWPQSVAVYDSMTYDAQVKSVLRAVTMPVLRTAWRIDPAGARDEVTQLVAEDLGLPIVGAQMPPWPRTRDRFSWHHHLADSMDDLVFGHAFFEQQVRHDSQGRARLRKLSPRLPHTIRKVNVAPDGGLISIEQHARAGRVTKAEQPIPVTRLVAYVHERRGGNWHGRSLLRAAYGDWLIKSRLTRVNAVTMDRNGMGVPLYIGPPSPLPDDLENGRKMASAWRSGDSSGAAIPNGAELKLLGVEGELPDILATIKYHDDRIYRAVLANFLNLDAKGGSYALASVQEETFTQSLQTCAQEKADVGTMHVVEDLVDWNFGPDEPAPRIVFDEIGSKQAATAQALKMLRDAGLILPDRVLEEQLRQQFGLPPKASPSPVQESGDPA